MYKNIGTDTAGVGLWEMVAWPSQTGQLFEGRFFNLVGGSNSWTLAHFGVFTSKTIYGSFLCLLLLLKTASIELYWSKLQRGTLSMLT